MSIIRTAQQKVDAHLDNLTLVQSIIESIKNPKAVQDSIKELIDGNSVSEAKKQEVIDAEDSIERAEKLLEKLSIDTANHNSYVESDKAAIEKLKDDFEKKKLSDNEEFGRAVEEFNKQKKEIEENFLAREAKLNEREKLFAQAIAVK